VLYHNREFKRLLGLQTSLQNMSLKELLGAGVDQHAEEVLKAGAPARIEVNHRYTDGRIVPIAVRIVPMKDPDSDVPRGLIMVLDDITAEKKMEEFLKHRQRIETMGHISATIAHEIRNPLASIRGAVQEIGRAMPIPEDKKVLLDIVLSESDRLDQIISDFLRFARMRPPQLASTDIGRVLSDVKILLSARPEAKDAQILLSGDEGEPFPADPEQLRQLFLNLGMNALQAMSASPRRELALRVCVMPRGRLLGFKLEQVLDRPGVLVEVTDTGPGMRPDVQGRIFEPFFTTKATGTGLGLAIAERIVQGHEGLIAFESQDGAGTTFRVWLPTNLATPVAGTSGLRSPIADIGVGRPGV
jgi:two-component system sensor histidine kinase PilS (NtrC family)